MVTTELQKLLAEAREPAIWFHTVENAHSQSRIGGLPSLPPGVDWPVSRDSGLPLHFMAQVELASLPETPLPGCPFQASLPREGMLFFFFCYSGEMGDWEDEGTENAGANSRVIFTPAAGEVRAAPEGLPENRHADNLLPVSHLRAYAIDTFWSPTYSGRGGKCVQDIPHSVRLDATFQSIVDITGTAAPVFPWDAIPSPRPSHYMYTPAAGPIGGPPEPRKVLSGLQMFGAESQWLVGDKAPRNKERVLLLEFPLDAHEQGSLQYWIKTADLLERHFERAGASAFFS